MNNISYIALSHTHAVCTRVRVCARVSTRDRNPQESQLYLGNLTSCLHEGLTNMLFEEFEADCVEGKGVIGGGRVKQ